MTDEQKVVLDYLESLADRPCDENWTEYHWREANEVLLNAKVLFGLDTWERIYEIDMIEQGHKKESLK